MDVGQLAATLTEWLRPALPYLLGAGKKAAGKAGEKLGAEAWKTAQNLWTKLRPEVEGESSAAAAAKDLASEPDDPDAEAALRRQLKKLLRADPELAEQVAALLPRAGATVVGGKVAALHVAVGRDVRGDVIVVNGAAGPMDAPAYWRSLGEPGDDELNAATERYLEILVDLYRYLDLRGMGISDRVPLRLPLLVSVGRRAGSQPFQLFGFEHRRVERRRLFPERCEPVRL